MAYIYPLVIALVVLLAPHQAHAAATGDIVNYRHGSQVLEGYVARNKSATGKLPAVLVVHDWNGLDEYEQRRARMLGDLGYVGFAVDIYGRGVRPDSTDKSKAESSKYYNDPQLLLARLNAALSWIKSQPYVDSGKIAAIGYCFGGHAVLDLARSGADIAGVASFHGSLGTTMPAQKGVVKARIVAFHGSADAAVGPDDVAAFHKELLNAGLGYGFVAYEGAVHGFTVPGNAYNENADKASWELLKLFLTEVFGK